MTNVIQQVTISSKLRESFVENADRMAVIDIAKNARYTYRDLFKRVAEIELAFIKNGIQKGDKVALFFPSSATWLCTFIALIDIGAIPVCLNDTSTSKELDYTIRFSDSVLAVTDENGYNRVKPILNSMSIRKLIVVGRTQCFSKGKQEGYGDFLDLKGYDKEQLTEKLSKLQMSVLPTDPLHIQFTSGTTGTPKAVVSMHCRMYSNVQVFYKKFEYTKDERIFSALPLYHVMGCFYTAILALLNGCSIILTGRFKTGVAIDAMIEEKCTSFHGVPTMYNYILNRLGDRQIPSLIKGMLAGAYCGQESYKEIAMKLKLKDLFAAYGQTEGVGYTILTTSDSFDKKATTVGKPVEGVELKIVNFKEGTLEYEELPPNTQGEIIANMPYRMLGYYKDDEATAKTIFDGSWIRTGDIGFLDEDGYLHISGRKKDVIIRGGENISPIEIEDTLREYHRVKDIVVTGIPDKVLGEEVAAFIIKADNSKDMLEDEYILKIKSYASKNLAPHKVPKYIKIVDSFPITSSGKIQKFKLIEEGI